MPKTQTTQSVSLACVECASRNYKTKAKAGQVIELKKFCKQCKRHTVHRIAK